LRAERPARVGIAALLILVGVAFTVYGVDQVSKQFVVTTLAEGEVVPVLGNVLQWQFVRNPGAAFSIASGMTWIFTILAAGVITFIIWFARRIRSIAWALVFGLLLGGVLGNLTDRLLREPGFPMGHVVDIISMPWMMPAIFNVADIFIVTGMISVALLVVLGLRFDGTRERDHAPVENDEQAEAAAVADETRPAIRESGESDAAAGAAASDGR
jgi:signal peptidase II